MGLLCLFYLFSVWDFEMAFSVYNPDCPVIDFANQADMKFKDVSALAPLPPALPPTLPLPLPPPVLGEH